MKLKTLVKINLGVYMDLQTEIEIDTENYQESRNLIRALHENFFGILQDNAENIEAIKQRVNANLRPSVEEWEKMSPLEIQYRMEMNRALNRAEYQVNKKKTSTLDPETGRTVKK